MKCTIQAWIFEHFSNLIVDMRVLTGHYMKAIRTWYMVIKDYFGEAAVYHRRTQLTWAPRQLSRYHYTGLAIAEIQLYS